MLRPLCVVMLAAMVVLSGCQASTKPKVVKTVSADEAPGVRSAPFNGQYQLFATQSGSGRNATHAGEPLATHRLRRGEPVGFRAGDDGALRGVAGTESIPLPRGRYLWEMRADDGQVDAGHTATVALIAGGFALLMIGTALAL